MRMDKNLELLVADKVTVKNSGTTETHPSAGGPSEQK